MLGEDWSSLKRGYFSYHANMGTNQNEAFPALSSAYLNDESH